LKTFHFAVTSRLSELSDGRFAYAMKRPLPDGRARLVLSGVELLERLVPLIPLVYANLASLRRRRAAQNQRGTASSRQPAWRCLKTP
jgi:hypothetical protein